MTMRFFILYGVFVAITMGLERVPAAMANESVAHFSVVAPQLVVVDAEFTLSVMEHDLNGVPIAPNMIDPPPPDHSIVLWAHRSDTGDTVSLSIGGGGNTFVATGNGIDHVQVTISGVESGTRIHFRADGYGVSDPNATFWSRETLVTAPPPVSAANLFRVSTPRNAASNVAFPIYLTPVQEYEQGDHHVTVGAGFTGAVELISVFGNVSPTLINLDVAAGASQMLMVTLDEARADNRIRVRFLPSEVTFRNEDEAQLNSTEYSVHSQVFADSTSLSAQGVTSQSLWQNTLWPLDSDQRFVGGWSMLTMIPGLGPDAQGLEFYTQLIPASVARDSLPGSQTLWSHAPVTVNTGGGGWVLEHDSEPFPNGIAGAYWLRRTFFSNGNSAGTRTTSTFINDSAEFDFPLDLVGSDGRLDSPEEPISQYGVDTSIWDAAIWSIPAGQDTVYHILGSFNVYPPPDEGPEENLIEVRVYVTLTSSNRTPGPSVSGGAAIPDSIWNMNYIVHSDEFSHQTGDPIPPGLKGDYWARIGVLADTDGESGSEYINTSGALVFPSKLQVSNAHGGPGDVVSVGVALELDGENAAGIQFDITADQGAVFQGAINQQPNFQITTASLGEGVTRVLMVSLSGDTTDGDDDGHHALMNLVYKLEDSLNYGDQINLVVENSIISNPYSVSLPHIVANGHIKVGVRGDLIGNDGIVNITDLTALIRMILQIDPYPGRETFEFFQADVNGDGALNILDAVRTINVILGRATAKPVATGPAGPVRMDMGDVRVMPDGQTAVPIRAQFDGGVAGLQLTLTYDPALISLGDVLPAGRLEGMSVLQHESNGTLRLVVYSIDGRTFQAAGLGTLLNLPVELTGMSSGELTISQVVFAGPQAESVPVTLMNSSVRVSSTPATFALLSNRPNPFNPSTQIAYEVPQQARVTLSVFNILGQEVIRLVDQVQAPGRYVVTWNGRDEKGAGVSSGVYMYRLTSATGYSDTRRMTLLK